MPKTLWKKIELYNAGGDVSKDWYISYYFFVKSSGTYGRIKLIQDMNSFKSIGKAMACAYVRWDAFLVFKTHNFVLFFNLVQLVNS